MTQTAAGGSQPILLDLDEGTWAEQNRRVEPWLATTRTLQKTFRYQVSGVARTVSEPHIRSYLGDVARTARRHEAVAAQLYPAFGLHRPRRTPQVLAGTLLAASRQATGQVMGRVAGARSASWRGLRELLRSNLDAISGFAVAEQLGLALGTPAAVDLVFPVLQEKQKDQLLLQEYLLEMASGAILRSA